MHPTAHMSVKKRPSVLGKYEVIRELGRGGMGVVYLATDTELGREVALKSLAPALNDHPTFIEQFRREARAVASVSDSRVVRIHNFGTFGGFLCIDMEYVEGRSLRSYLAEGVLAPERATCLVSEILGGLSACHEREIIHRDLKPSNILLTQEGAVRIVDFGLATAYASYLEDTLTDDATASVFWGTARYAPPEAWDGVRPRPDWDVYAVGALLYEALSGETPYDGASPLTLLRAISQGEPEPIDGKVSGVSQELSDIVGAMLSHDPAERPADAHTALEALQAVPEYQRGVDAGYLHARPSVSPPSLGRRLRRRTERWGRHLRVAGVAMLLLTPMLFSGVTWWRYSDVEKISTSAPAPAPPLPTQETVLATTLVGRDALLATLRESPEVGAQVFEVISMDQVSERLATGLYRPGAAAGEASVVFMDEARLVGATLNDRGSGVVEGVGGWAGYGDSGGTRLGFGPVELAGRWISQDALSVSISYHNTRTGAVRKETVFGQPLEQEFTDTRFVAELESHPLAQPLLFGELAGVEIPGMEVVRACFPAVAPMRLRVQAVPDRGAPTVDGRVVDRAWHGQAEGAVLAGVPYSSGSTLRACHDGKYLYLALTIPPVDSTGYIVHIELVDHWGPNLAETRRVRLQLPSTGDARAWIAYGAQLFRTDADLTFMGRTSETETAMELRLEPPGGIAALSRLNIQVQGAGETDGAGPVLTWWGWPEVVAAQHGVMLDAEVSR